MCRCRCFRNIGFHPSSIDEKYVFRKASYCLLPILKQHSAQLTMTYREMQPHLDNFLDAPDFFPNGFSAAIKYMRHETQNKARNATWSRGRHPALSPPLAGFDSRCGNDVISSKLRHGPQPGPKLLHKKVRGWSNF